MSGIQLRIGADTSDLERGLSQSQAMLRDNARQMQRNIGVAAKYTAAIVAAGAALSVHLVRQTMNAIDEQSKLARSLGTSVDALTALQIAGERAGISQGSLNAALATYTARLGEARRGTGQGVVAFDRLGLSAEELAGIPLDEQMQLIGERVRGLGLDASETADLLRNLGIRNREMIGFIREGTADLENARDIMNQFGLAISDVDAQRIEAANDALAKIGMTSRGLRQIIAVELAGPLEAVAEALSDTFGGMSDEMREGVQQAVRVAIDALASVLDGAAGLLEFVGRNPTTAQFGVLGAVLLGPKGAAAGIAIGGLFAMIRRELALLGVGIDGFSDEFIDLARVQRDIARVESQLEELDDIHRTPIQFRDVIEEGLLRELEHLNAEAARLEPLVENSEDAFQDLLSAIGQGGEGVGAAADVARNLADVLRESVNNTRDLNEEAENLVETLVGDGEPVIPGMSEEEMQAFREYLQGRVQAIRESQMSELELLEQHHEEKKLLLDTALKNEVIDAQEHQEMLNRIEQDGADARLAIAEREANARRAILSESMSNLSTLMQTGSRELFAIGKAAAISEAIINGQAAVTASYRRGANIGGPPVGAAFAATAAAATGVQISRLASTQFGSGTGGAPATGAGAGGGAGIPQAAAQTAGREQTLLVQGDFTQDQLFTGSTVRKLIESIAEQQRDGFTVVI